MSDLERLLDLWEALGPRERKVVLSFSTRLLAGQRLHGELTLDKKQWGYEAIEEALDGCVYLTCMLNDYVDRSINGIAARAEAEVTAGYVPCTEEPEPVTERDPVIVIEDDYDYDSYPEIEVEDD